MAIPQPCPARRASRAPRAEAERRCHAAPAGSAVAVADALSGYRLPHTQNWVPHALACRANHVQRFRTTVSVAEARDLLRVVSAIDATSYRSGVLVEQGGAKVLALLVGV